MTVLPSLVVAIVFASPPAALLSRQHFDRARHAFAQHDYRRALDDFTAAAEAAPTELPDLWFDIAQCHRNLGHARQAVLAFEHYLALKPDAADRAKVEAMIVQLGGTPPAPPAAASDSAPVEARAAPAPAPAPTPSTTPGPTIMPPLSDAQSPPPVEPSASTSAPATALTAGVILNATPVAPPPPRRKKWIVWTAVGASVAVSALAVGLGVGLGVDTRSAAPPTPAGLPMLGSAGTFDTRSH